MTQPKTRSTEVQDIKQWDRVVLGDEWGEYAIEEISPPSSSGNSTYRFRLVSPDGKHRMEAAKNAGDKLDVVVP